MVCFHSSISVCNSVDQQSANMSSANSTDLCLKSKHSNQVNRNRKVSNSSNNLNVPACNRSRSAVVDVVILIAVICAFGILIFPYINLFYTESLEIMERIFYLMREEISQAPLIYGSLALSIIGALIAVWLIVIITSRKCGNPNCRGLRKAAEFDIQLETEDVVKNSNSNSSNKTGTRKGLFELPRDHHQELEAELKKMAPLNGRAVLIFRARCGCSVGRMEVPGPRKVRKIKKYG